MDPSENPQEIQKPAEMTGTRELSEFDELRESLQSLRSLFHVTLITLVILAGSLSVFLLREVSLVRQQVREVNQFVATYETTSVPMMGEFRRKLIEFAKTDPNFAQILGKYFSPTNFTGASKVSPAPPSNEGFAPRMPDLPEK